MAQGKLRTKSSAPPKRKAVRKALSIALNKQKRAIPQKPKRSRDRRDPAATKVVHKNIERLIAAKAMKNEGHLRLRELSDIGKKQLKFENASKNKKKRTKEDAEETKLKNASKRLEK